MFSARPSSPAAALSPFRQALSTVTGIHQNKQLLSPTETPEEQKKNFLSPNTIETYDTAIRICFFCFYANSPQLNAKQQKWSIAVGKCCEPEMLSKPQSVETEWVLVFITGPSFKDCWKPLGSRYEIEVQPAGTLDTICSLRSFSRQALEFSIQDAQWHLSIVVSFSRHVYRSRISKRFNRSTLQRPLSDIPHGFNDRTMARESSYHALQN